MAEKTTAPLPRAERKLTEWTSSDHAAKCPTKAWLELPRDIQEKYRKLGPTDTAARDAFKKQYRGAAPDCINDVEGGCCPDDLVINAGSQTLFIGGANGERTVGIGGDPPRVDPGDRRRGLYYFDLVSKGLLSGLQQVKKVPLVRLAELEKTRQIRTGERPADWILKARARSDEGKGPPVFEDKRTAMSELQRAATGVPDPEL